MLASMFDYIKATDMKFKMNIRVHFSDSNLDIYKSNFLI